MVDVTTMYPYVALVLITFTVTSECLSIDKVSDITNVSDAKVIEKRETDPGSTAEFFPDWVPFKNKHGEDLGEFKQVQKKSKLKKRLALPINFILRAVAEPDGDDYYDKGQGESEGEDNFEKSDWSDTNRQANKQKVDIVPETVVNNPDLLDIDGIGGVVDIIKTIPKSNFNGEEKTVYETTEPKPTPILEIGDEPIPVPPPVKHHARISKQHPKPEKVKNERPRRYEDDVEYDEVNSNVETKPKEQKEEKEDKDDNEGTQEEETSENDANKSKILDSVDELRERHVQEQKIIAAKAKEDLVYAEERERDNLSAKRKFDKYDYDEKPKKTGLFYDDYDDRQSMIEDKYQIIPLTRPEQGTKATTTKKPIASQTQRRKKQKKKEKEVETKSGKLSVFKNPRLFMVYDDSSDSEPSENKPTTAKTIASSSRSRISARFNKDHNMTRPNNQAIDNIKISLVPEDGRMKSDEPALFFPRRVKTRGKKKKPARLTDNSVAQSKQSNMTINTITAPDTSASAASAASAVSGPSGPTASYPSSGSIESAPTASASASLSSLETAPSASSIVTSPATSSESLSSGPSDTGFSSVERGADLSSKDATRSDVDKAKIVKLNDAVAAPSDHKKEDDKPENFEHEHGGAKEYHSKHEEDHEEHGKKAYEGHHEDTKAAQGHHDKETHHGVYDDHHGHDKEHHHETGHYGEHHHEENGKKHAKYEESGKHSKGHSTKGSHDIHKKEEYEKKVEFFEEDGDSGEEEKHGGYSHDRSHGKGGHFKEGSSKGGHHQHAKGETGNFVKGGHGHVDKGHKSAAGHDEHHKSGGDSFHKEGKQGGKKWIFHHGHPAKNANLVVIDRREDQIVHGPTYYG